MMAKILIHQGMTFIKVTIALQEFHEHWTALEFYAVEFFCKNK